MAARGRGGVAGGFGCTRCRGTMGGRLRHGAGRFAQCRCLRLLYAVDGEVRDQVTQLGSFRCKGAGGSVGFFHHRSVLLGRLVHRVDGVVDFRKAGCLLLGGDGDGIDLLGDQRMRRSLVEAINKLPEREQHVMSMYYEHDMNLKEIAAVLKVTESRVCQLHSQSIARLRAKLRAH